MRKGAKFFPGKFNWGGDFAGDFEVPLGFVEMRDAAIVKDWPFESKRLTGRETAFGAGPVLELFAIGVGRKQSHGVTLVG